MKNLLFLAAIALLACCISYAEMHRQRRRIGIGFSAVLHKYDPERSKIQFGRLKNPCNTTDNDLETTSELYFCYQNNKTQAVFTFNQSLLVGGYAMRDWAGYDWYLDCSGMRRSHHWWGNVFATTGSWNKDSFGFSTDGQRWRKQITLVKTKGQVILNLNTTQYALSKPEKYGNTLNSPCHGLLLCVWRPHAQDPCVPLLLCPNITDVIQKEKLPEVTAGPKSTSARPEQVLVRPSIDDWFKVTTGVTQRSNNWLLMAEQAGIMSKTDCVVCMGARPLLHVVPSTVNKSCLLPLMNYTVPTTNCSLWDTVYPLTKAQSEKPLFSSKVAAANFTCINRTGSGLKLGNLSATSCADVLQVDLYFMPQSRSDIWWWCGDNRLFDRLPYNTTGLCASVSLILPTLIFPLTADQLLANFRSILPYHWRQKRSMQTSMTGWSKDDPTYIDGIGVPRGVPDEYKLADQIAAGWESSICWWCTTNKTVDRINYIHYNVQRLGNMTADGFSAIHEQLSATSLMAFQNRIAVDMLLAEKGGVCAMFGEQCCTFIPNNTAPDGKLTEALEGLRSLNNKMKDHSGVDTSFWDGFGDMFGRYRDLVLSAMMSLALFAALLTICGCCCIPCIRSLVEKLIHRAVDPVQTNVTEMYALLSPRQHSDDDDSDEEEGMLVPTQLFSPETQLWTL